MLTPSVPVSSSLSPFCFGFIGHSKEERLYSAVGSHKEEKIKQPSKARCEWDGTLAERTNQRSLENMGDGDRTRGFPLYVWCELD